MHQLELHDAALLICYAFKHSVIGSEPSIQSNWTLVLLTLFEIDKNSILSRSKLLKPTLNYLISYTNLDYASNATKNNCQQLLGALSSCEFTENEDIKILERYIDSKPDFESSVYYDMIGFATKVVQNCKNNDLDHLRGLIKQMLRSKIPNPIESQVFFKNEPFY